MASRAAHLLYFVIKNHPLADGNKRCGSFLFLWYLRRIPALRSFLGALVGGEIGGRMDEKDRQRTALALENARTGSSTRWVNPDTGDRYEVQPTRIYQSAAGQSCRDYTMQAVIDGRNETINGTACRRADCTWE